MSRHLQASLLLLTVGAACRPAGEVKATPVAIPASVPSVVPKAWSEAGVPGAGLLRVLPESNEHGFYADYAGGDRDALLAEVSRGLARAGYSQSCTAFDGAVLGFSKGGRQLAVKVDAVPVLVLSVFDEKGKDPILHGVCFGRYRAGPSRRLDQDEKEALMRDAEGGEGTPETPSPSPPR